MSPNVLFIYETALRLAEADSTMSGQSLAGLMNARGLRTTHGTPYTGHGRGIHKAIDRAYQSVARSLGDAEAKKVALAFTKMDGTYAYKD